MKLLIASLVLTLVALCGCGGGGGAGGAGGASSVGMMTLPDGSLVKVEKSGPITAGMPGTFQITLSGATSAPSLVLVWISVDPPEDTGTAAIWRDGSAYAYDITLDVPSPSTGDHLYFEVQYADGTTLASGPDDFPLD